jgi:hypothetical protein
MPVAVQNTKKSLPLKKIGVLAGLLLTIVAILSGLIAVNQRADIRNRAAGPACTTFDARCAWSAIPGVSEYEYTYTISGTDETAISGKTDKTSFEFPAKPGIIYTCMMDYSCRLTARVDSSATLQSRFECPAAFARRSQAA